MAECLDEFEEATPLQKRFCSQLTVEEFEQSTADSTEEALAQLIAHLDTNPQAYHKILQAKKDEEIGVFSYIKMKLLSYFSVHDASSSSSVSEEECSEKLDTLKQNMIKSFNYSHGSRGHRFSKRLIDRQVHREVEGWTTPTRGVAPPPPPPPPSLPTVHRRRRTQCTTTPLVHATLTRRPISSAVRQAKTRKLSSNVPNSDLISQLKGSECKRRLRPINTRSTKDEDPDETIPFFNAMLLKKFKNTQSPSFTMASPGSFESPVLPSFTTPLLPSPLDQHDKENCPV